MTKKEKILVIDGHATFGQQIVKLLNDDGFDATYVGNGADAVKAIYDMLPRLIVLNVDLEDVDSYTILQKKDAEPLLKKIPAILISTKGLPINMSKIPQGSVADLLIQFIEDAPSVVAAVEKHLGVESNTEKVAKASASHGSKKKVLWIEDDNMINTIMGKKIISAGYELLSAKDGDEALKILKTTIPDAIVMDLMLPGMSGFELLQKFRMEPTYKDIPSMILSNLDSVEDREKAKMLGANKYFVKAGFSLEQITNEIENLIAGK